MSSKRSPKTIEQLKEGYTEELLRIPGVIAVGIGQTGRSHRPCLNVYLSSDDPVAQTRIRKVLRDFPAVVLVSGAAAAGFSDKIAVAEVMS